MDLNSLKTKKDIALDQDRTGSYLVDSAIYTLTIKAAYLRVADSGAMGLVLESETENSQRINQTFYMTSGTAKGGKNVYTDKQGNEQYLPGFIMANTLALLTVGEEIGDVDVEEKTINAYDREAGKELPTKVQMFVPLCGQKIKAGILRKIVDKTTKESGYKPTGETIEINEIDKFFRESDDMTVTEITAEAPEANFLQVWDKKWTGVTPNVAKGAAQGGNAGAPRSPAQGNQQAPKKLFAK